MMIGLLGLNSIKLLAPWLLIATLARRARIISKCIVLDFYSFKILLINILLLVFQSRVLTLGEIYLLLVLNQLLRFLLRALRTLVARVHHVI